MARAKLRVHALTRPAMTELLKFGGEADGCFHELPQLVSPEIKPSGSRFRNGKAMVFTQHNGTESTINFFASTVLTSKMLLNFKEALLHPNNKR